MHFGVSSVITQKGRFLENAHVQSVCCQNLLTYFDKMLSKHKFQIKVLATLIINLENYHPF